MSYQPRYRAWRKPAGVKSREDVRRQTCTLAVDGQLGGWHWVDRRGRLKNNNGERLGWQTVQEMTWSAQHCNMAPMGVGDFAFVLYRYPVALMVESE